jgi:3',5'-cyclic AMP phosphodiesterase CpdA
MEFQYASDLHIDHFPTYDFASLLTPVAPVLLLAGDLCSAWKPAYAAFLRWCSPRWRFIVVLAGNHEYFCEEGEVHTIDDTDREIERITSMLGNVAFLQNGDSVLLPGTSVRIVGATLWSAVDPAIHHAIRHKGDYEQTYTATPFGARKTTPMDIAALHSLQKAYLHSTLAKFSADQIILMTHHLPSFSLQEEVHRGKEYSSCYASADDDLFLHRNVRVVLCGHTHRSFQGRLPGGARAVLNARGYPKEARRLTEAYSPRATIRL